MKGKEMREDPFGSIAEHTQKMALDNYLRETTATAASFLHASTVQATLGFLQDAMPRFLRLGGGEPDRNWQPQPYAVHPATAALGPVVPPQRAEPVAPAPQPAQSRRRRWLSVPKW